jgi:tryptophanyl-tRNA synthetase
LIGIIWEYFARYRKKREALVKNRDDVHQILRAGMEKARAIAGEYLSKARHNVGLDYWI